MTESPKRFYETATSERRGGAYAVMIDGRQLRTPGKAPFLLPTNALAEACAQEWREQVDVIRPETMPLTRLANVALDRTPETRLPILETIEGYAATDLVCHRAERPEALVLRQAAVWDPLVAWAKDELGAALKVAAGVVALDQPDSARAAYGAAARDVDDFRLTGIAHAVGISGSGVIGFALAGGRLDADGAYVAACVDDLWQLETWGEDFIARQRLDSLKDEFDALGAWFAALRAR